MCNTCKGLRGKQGYSAYQVALNNFYEGTEAEWLLTLKGEQGDPGVDESLTWEDLSPLLTTNWGVTAGKTAEYAIDMTKQLLYLRGVIENTVDANSGTASRHIPFLIPNIPSTATVDGLAAKSGYVTGYDLTNSEVALFTLCKVSGASGTAPGSLSENFWFWYEGANASVQIALDSIPVIRLNLD